LPPVAAGWDDRPVSESERRFDAGQVAPLPEHVGEVRRAPVLESAEGADDQESSARSSRGSWPGPEQATSWSPAPGQNSIRRSSSKTVAGVREQSKDMEQTIARPSDGEARGHPRLGAEPSAIDHDRGRLEQLQQLIASWRIPSPTTSTTAMPSRCSTPSGSSRRGTRTATRSASARGEAARPRLRPRPGRPDRAGARARFFLAGLAFAHERYPAGACRLRRGVRTNAPGASTSMPAFRIVSSRAHSTAR
jgi:hypothetical protein